MAKSYNVALSRIQNIVVTLTQVEGASHAKWILEGLNDYQIEKLANHTSTGKWEITAMSLENETEHE